MILLLAEAWVLFFPYPRSRLQFLPCRACASERRNERSFFLLIGARLPSYTGLIFCSEPREFGISLEAETAMLEFSPLPIDAPIQTYGLKIQDFR